MLIDDELISSLVRNASHYSHVHNFYPNQMSLKYITIRFCSLAHPRLV